MMTLVALAAIAAHDLLDVLLRWLLVQPRIHRALEQRPRVRVLSQVLVQVMVIVGVVVGCLLLWGPRGWLACGAAAVVMLGWAWTHRWWAPAGVVLVVILALVASMDLTMGNIGSGSGISILGAGAVVVVFLLESGNRITRSVLSLTGRPRQAVAPSPVGTLSRAEAAPGDKQGDDPVKAPPLPLKGGRYIGPMERILVLGLGLAGAQSIIAALLAAKGIVRFPEISADREFGSRAEEFLVGSLASWGLAAGGALLLWLWQNY